MKILAISGSLRNASHNTSLLRAARELAPEGVELELWSGLKAVPPYDEDDEVAGAPAVVELFDAIAGADAVLFATPEYNSSIPGQLKNAVDWASRPPGRSVLNGKPAAVMGASPGGGGTARAQLQLRQAFVFTQTIAMLQPEVLVAKASEKFDAQGRLTDEATRGFLRKFLEAFGEWIGRVGSA
jgi:chromate reductase, NAD(P)H dehydrogenase (quinone)